MSDRTYTFLIHESLIWAIINDTLAKYGGCKLPIYLFRIQFGMFAIQNEIVSLGAQENCGGLTKKNESEAVSVLGSTIHKKPIRVHAILNGASNERKEMEHDRRAMGVFRIELSQDVLGDSN